MVKFNFFLTYNSFYIMAASKKKQLNALEYVLFYIRNLNIQVSWKIFIMQNSKILQNSTLKLVIDSVYIKHWLSDVTWQNYNMLYKPLTHLLFLNLQWQYKRIVANHNFPKKKTLVFGSLDWSSNYYVKIILGISTIQLKIHETI